MSSVATLIADMVRAGVDPDLIGRTAEAIADNARPLPEPSESKGALRTARWRAKKASQTVTVTSRDVTTSHEERFPQTPSEENPSPKEKTLREKKKTVSRIPDDFKPDLEWAVAQGLSRSQAEMQAASFCDFWRGAKDGLKADWPATWRNWVRKFIERNGIQPPKPSAAPDTAKAPQDLEKHWLGRLEYGRTHHRWLCDQWGPMPGATGCRAPPELLKPGDGDGWRKWESAAA